MTREIKNEFPACPEDFVLTEELKQEFNLSIAKYLGFIENAQEYKHFLGLRDDFDDAKQDSSVYTGQAGIAFLYFHLKQYSKAEAVLRPFLQGLRGKPVTFLCGDAGPLALAAVIYSVLDKKMIANECVRRLTSLAEYALSLDRVPDEILYGRSGYLFSLLFVRKFLGSRSIDDGVIANIAKAILVSGQKLSKETRSRCPLMYEWYNERYYGAAHGLAGIYFMLMQSEALSDIELRELLKPSVDYLLGHAFPSGNFPSSMGNENDKLVHWCHGAPGFVQMLLKAHSIWGDQKYMDAALKGGENIWERGLLRKGDGLCHGTAGNAYSFLALYQANKDVKWLYRACMFGFHCTRLREHISVLPDRPLSLFEGLAGTVYFLQDLKEPLQAKFPAYEL